MTYEGVATSAADVDDVTTTFDAPPSIRSMPELEALVEDLVTLIVGYMAALSIRRVILPLGQPC
ncbi:hypothetical protein [Rhodococcus tibetensis]|uniref:Uncharacterized protein n=1 Tax=Rhodococcus tibetensis TaxID=2965064 RepID=A0ABT1QIJ2_9NOCA|nr:hypothetical protein [Rhodococcus sp. FXJ9.536]MCQ4122066.1 hypothetical protein [Rhodococcus sp. FXJ9.536]